MCMCVCTHARVFVRACVCVCVCVYVGIYICIWMSYTYMYVCKFGHSLSEIPSLFVFIYNLSNKQVKLGFSLLSKILRVIVSLAKVNYLRI